MARGRRSLAQTLAAPRAPQPGPLLAAAEGDGPQLVPPGEGKLFDSPAARFNDALVVGDADAAAGHFLEMWRQRGYDMSGELNRREPFALITRLARAFAHLGQFAPEDLLVRATALTEADLAAFDTRWSGDEEQEARWAAQEDATRRPGYNMPADPDAFWSLARAILRTPSRFNARAFPAAGAPRQVNIQVSNSLLLDLADNERAHPAFRGLKLLTGSIRRGVSTRTLAAAIDFEAEIDGTPTRVQAWTVLGDTKALDAAGRLKSARGMVKRNRQQFASLVDELRDEGRTLASGALSAPQGELAAGAPKLDADQMLGPDICSHARAVWRLNSIQRTGPAAADAVIRTCDQCHRERLEVLPLHRLHSEHHLAHGLRDEQVSEAYLARERFHAELAGDQRPVVSLAQLRARDGIAPEPAPATSGAAPAVPHAQRAGSFDDALASVR